MKNLKKLLLLIALLFVGCSTKTNVYQKNPIDKVDVLLTTKSYDKYLFLGQKYQYLFEESTEVNKLKELMRQLSKAESYRLEKIIDIDVHENGKMKFYITLNIAPKDEQLSSLKKLGFKQSVKATKHDNGKWSKSYTLEGKIALKDLTLENIYAQKKLKNIYTVHITFKENAKNSISIPRPNNGLVILFWLAVLL